MREHAQPPGHPSTVAALVELGDVLADLGRCREALPLYVRAQTAADAPDMPPYLPIASRLGRGHCLVAIGQRAAAVPLLRDALARNADPKTDDDRKLAAQVNAELARATK